MKRVASRIVPIAVIIAVVLGFKFYKKNNARNEVREQIAVLIEEFPNYDDHQAFYDAAFDELHAEAFDYAYAMGGRRTSSSFDEDKYLAVLLALMSRKATALEETEIASSLELHRQALGLPSVGFE